MSKPHEATRALVFLACSTVLVCPAVRADDCIRSKPVPILAAGRGAVQAHTFTLKSDHEAVERFTLGSGL